MTKLELLEKEFVDNGQISLSTLKDTFCTITDDFLRHNQFEIKESYDVQEWTKIVSRSLLVVSFERLCLKLNCSHGLMTIETLDGVDYLDIDCITTCPFPIDIVMFSVFGGPFLQLPYSFMKEDHLYLSYNAIIAILEMPDFKKTEASNKIKFKTYVMFDEASGCYKIGKAKNIEFREDVLGAQLPMVRTILYSDENLEAKLHRQYASKRKRGEWFTLTADDILDIIKDYKFKKP